MGNKIFAMTGINSEFIGLDLFFEKPMDLDPTDQTVNCHKFPTDAELCQAITAGESSALGVIYDRYASLVYRLALKMLSNPQEAEDLTQEIFLILWRSNTYNSARGSLGSFLTTLTRSRAIDKLRSRGSNFKFLQRWSQMMETETSPTTPFELASLKQRSHYVQTALSQLPEKQRQVLEMAYYEGMSQSEIAKNLNIPLGTIKTWCRQGLLNLKKHLQEFIE